MNASRGARRGLRPRSLNLPALTSGSRLERETGVQRAARSRVGRFLDRSAATLFAFLARVRSAEASAFSFVIAVPWQLASSLRGGCWLFTRGHGGYSPLLPLLVCMTDSPFPCLVPGKNKLATMNLPIFFVERFRE